MSFRLAPRAALRTASSARPQWSSSINSNAKRQWLIPRSRSFATTPSRKQQDLSEIPITERFSLKGRNILVTGGGQGIGFSAAKAIAQLGGGVAVIDHTPQPPEEFNNFADKYGVKTSYQAADVSDRISLEKAFHDSVEAVGGKLHGCVTAAGINIDEPFVDADWDKSKKLLDVNVLGSFWTGHLVAKHMVDNDLPGSIVFVCSISGQGVSMPVQKCTIYNASKAAIKGMVGPLAVELGPSGIRVNCISPGCIATPMVQKLETDNPTIVNYFRTASAAGRLGVTEDLNPMICYLLSDAGSFSTGSDFHVTGGIHAGSTREWNFRNE